VFPIRTLLVATLLPLHAWAWDTPSPSATALASAAAHSASRASNRVSIANSVTTTSGNAPARAPDVFAPAVSGGNNCAVGASAGGSGPLAGGLLGLLWESHGCALRQEAAIMANLGRADVAVEILCREMDVRRAMADAGTPCAEDRRLWEAAGWSDPRRVERRR
jgi:hypothetical protein